MLLKWRLSALLALALLAGGTFGFAKPPAKAKGKTKKGANAASSAATKSAGTVSPQAAKPSKQAGKAGSQAADPAVAPIAATTGTLGLFTVETGDLLPKGGFSFAGYANKFTRMPGSVSFLQYGVNVAYGLSDRFNIYVGFLPDVHSHISDSNPGSHLSLDTPDTSSFPLFPGPSGPTMYRVLGAGQTPGYVEDYPFAAHNGGGVGPVTIGVKFGLLSERSGAPVSLSVRNDFIIPTVTGLGPLLINGTQTGQFNDQIGVALSKDWNRQLILTGNYGFRFTRNPSFSGVQSMDQADQSIVGVGFIAFPEKRIQVMSEYTAVLFSGGTANDSFGARDPVDGVWGVRLYPQPSIAVDLGYRYMLNLSNAQDRSGFVIKVGATLWPSHPAPPPVNHSPVAACSQDKNSLFAESNDAVNVTATASDPDGDPINYRWSATGGRVDGTGPRVRWLPAGAAPGSYTITLTVDDGRGGMATCAVDARVDPRPNRPPTVTLSADRDTVLVGERVHFTATGADPDNDPLTYTWRTNGGNLTAAGTSGDLDTTGLAPAPYTVTVRVDDGRGGAADASRAVNVQAPPSPPQASKLSGCDFKPATSPRVDNICKRVLDDVALRLQNEPRATVVIIGYADPKERRPAKLAGDRSGNAAKYLTDKGLASARVNTRAGAGQAGAGQANRRIDVIWVPEGATY